jgi:DNA polymerase-3 subunit beta
MDLKLHRSDVLQELSLVQGVVERRTTIPILSNILLEAEGDRLRMTATDLDMTVMTSCPGEVRAEGRLTVASKVFQELVRNLPEEEFALRQDGDAVEITSGRFRSRMALLDAAEFPSLPEEPSQEGFEISLPLFQLVFSRVAFAITKEDPKFQLNGALVKFLPGELEVAATDGHRLAVVRARTEAGEPPFERQLFPRKLLTEFSRFSDETVVISMLENHLGFRIGSRSLISRLVDLRFPQYEKVIVRDNPHRARVGREDLLGALRRVSLLAHEKARGVRFQFSPGGELRLVSIGKELGTAEEVLPIEYQGASIDMALNAAYLIDVLNVLDTELVEIQLRDASTQCVLVPVNDDQRLEEYIYVLMPMRV